MIAAMECGKPRKRYLLGWSNLHLTDWLAIVGRVVKRCPPRWQVPYWMALATAWTSEEFARYCTGRMPNATLTGVRLTRRSMHFNPAPSLAELGVRPRPLEEAATDAVAWYRTIGWI
jgi:dihydroflavonol-4-reductase